MTVERPCERRHGAMAPRTTPAKCYPRFPGAPKTPAFPPLNVRWNALAAKVALEQLKMLPAWVEQLGRVGDRLRDIIVDG